MGHDAVAHHKIRLTRTGATWRVAWRGLVGEAYSGKESFNHEFIVEAEDVPFVGLSLWGFDPAVAERMYNLDLSEPKAAEFLQPYINAADRFRLERVKGNLFASWT